GSQRIQELVGAENYARMKAGAMEIVGQHFRPEFVNRTDDVVVFRPLEAEHIRKIVGIQLDYLRRRPAERDIELVLDAAARDRLAEAGCDPLYGARPLKRASQQQIENPLAQRTLRGDFGPDDTIRVITEGESLSFEKGPKTADAAAWRAVGAV